MVLGVKRRGQRRVKIKCPVLIRTSYGWIVGETLNISATGVLVCCNKQLGIKEVFEVVIEAHFSGPPLNATAQVVWAGIHGINNEFSPHIMGMRFTKISNRDRNLISQLVSKHYQKKRSRIFYRRDDYLNAAE